MSVHFSTHKIFSTTPTSFIASSTLRITSLLMLCGSIILTYSRSTKYPALSCFPASSQINTVAWYVLSSLVCLYPATSQAFTTPHFSMIFFRKPYVTPNTVLLHFWADIYWSTSTPHSSYLLPLNVGALQENTSFSLIFYFIPRAWH